MTIHPASAILLWGLSGSPLFVGPGGDDEFTPPAQFGQLASLALAMTEKHEKAERAAIMQEQGCTELEAVYAVAERIARKRGS